MILIDIKFSILFAKIKDASYLSYNWLIRENPEKSNTLISSTRNLRYHAEYDFLMF